MCVVFKSTSTYAYTNHRSESQIVQSTYVDVLYLKWNCAFAFILLLKMLPQTTSSFMKDFSSRCYQQPYSDICMYVLRKDTFESTDKYWKVYINTYAGIHVGMGATDPF